MMKRWIGLCLLLFTASWGLSEDPLLCAWEFDQDGDAEGWTHAHAMAPLTVSGGVLQARCTGSDPYMTVFIEPGIEANPFQYILIRYRTRKSEDAEFFWAPEAQGKAAGFAAGLERSLGLVPDGTFRTALLFPLWEGVIRGLRFDPWDNDLMEIDWIRIYQQSYEMPPVSTTQWDFSKDGEVSGVIPQRDLTPLQVSEGVARTTALARGPVLLLSPMEASADRLTTVSMRMSVSSATTCRILWSQEAAGSFSPGHSVTVSLPGDGQMHGYNVECASSKAWKNTIRRIELSLDCAPGTELVVDDVGLYSAPQGPEELRVLRFSSVPAVPLAGERMRIELELENAGGESLPLLSCKLRLSPPFVLESESLQTVASLSGGRQAKLIWKVRTPVHSSGESQASLRIAGVKMAPLALPLRCYDAKPRPMPARDLLIETDEQQIVIGKGPLQAVIPRLQGRTPPVFLFQKQESGWKTVARSSRVAHLEVLDQKKTSSSRPLELREVDVQEDRRICLTLGAEKCLEVVKVFFEPQNDGHEMSIRAEASGLSGFTHFSGPFWLVGDGTFGSKKDQALFPGIEYLSSEERSSGELDIAPPHHLRFAPHPNKITLPTLAIEQAGSVFGVRWDPLQKWDGEHTRPSVAFASPNFLDAQENHLMGVFLPSIPEFVPENSLKATIPCDRSRVEVTHTVFTMDGDVLSASDHFFEQKRIPEWPEIRRSYEETLELSMRAYEEVLWNEDSQGWAGVQGWPANEKMGPSLHLLLASALLPRDPRAQEWSRKAERIGGASQGWPLAMVAGDPLRGVKDLEARARRAMASQGSEGGWAFQPTPQTSSLGEPGETAVGLCASQAADILQYALISGNEEAERQGLKALAFMGSFKVPRAAQVWEVPVHTPDLLASAQACDAYLLGYQLTGEDPYLQKAVFWARTGLPFIYAWQAPEIDPVMLYGSIPVFGATFYTWSWFGRLVQWNGLAYAHSLYRLEAFDQSLPWRHVATGLVRSGINQQQTETGFQGLYPDSYGMIDNSISWGLMLGPAGLLQTLLPMMGMDPWVGTVRVNASGREIRITAPARISHGQTAGTEDLSFTVEPSLPVPCGLQCIVAGLPGPRDVRKGDPFPDSSRGFQYDPISGLSVLRLDEVRYPTQVRLGGRIRLDGWEIMEEPSFGEYVLKIYTSYKANEGYFEILQRGQAVYAQHGCRFKQGLYPEGAVPMGSDLTGDGIPDLLVSEWTGREGCCFVIHVFEIGQEFRELARVEAGAAQEVRFEAREGRSGQDLVIKDADTSEEKIYRWTGLRYQLNPMGWSHD